MPEFTVQGPFDVPVRHEGAARVVDHDNLVERFWRLNDCGSRRGCYVFGLRTASGTIPFYVGMTLISFESECFDGDKLAKYITAIAKRLKGTPVMFFICSEGRGTYEHAIRSLELQLIGLAEARNPDDLMNIVGTNDDPIIIRGVFGHGKGHPSGDATKFKKMMGIRDIARHASADARGRDDGAEHSHPAEISTDSSNTAKVEGGS
jgi:hypothetical protein